MVDLNGLGLDRTDSGGLEGSNENKYPDIPSGDYFGYLSNSVEKSKNQTYINFTFTIAEGRFKGRKIFHMAFITGGGSPKGLSFIKRLQEVTDRVNCENSDDMNNIGIILQTELVADEYKGQGKYKSIIVGLVKTTKIVQIEEKKSNKVDDNDLEDTPF